MNALELAKNVRRNAKELFMVLDLIGYFFETRRCLCYIGLFAMQ